MEKQSIKTNKNETLLKSDEVFGVETVLEDMILKMKKLFGEYYEQSNYTTGELKQQITISEEIRKLIECIMLARNTTGNLLEVGTVECDESEIKPYSRDGMSLSELTGIQLTEESSNRINELAEKLLKYCRQGYSVNEINGALHKVGQVIDNLPTK